MKYSNQFLLVLTLVGCITASRGAAANEPNRSPSAKGGMDGGGGFATVCGSDNGVFYSTIAKWQVLDYAEATYRKENKLHIDLGDNSLTRDQKIEIVLKRLERVNPTRANRYRQWAQEFLNEADFSGHPYGRADLGAGSLPAECAAPSIIINQGIPLFNGDSRYYIAPLFNKFSAETQAGLMLHEFIYREVINSGNASSSKGVRYFNSLIASKEIEKMTAAQVRNIAEKIGLPDFDVAGMNLQFVGPGRSDPLTSSLESGLTKLCSGIRSFNLKGYYAKGRIEGNLAEGKMLFVNKDWESEYLVITDANTDSVRAMTFASYPDPYLSLHGEDLNLIVTKSKNSSGENHIYHYSTGMREKVAIIVGDDLVSLQHKGKTLECKFGMIFDVESEKFECLK